MVTPGQRISIITVKVFLDTEYFKLVGSFLGDGTEMVGNLMVTMGQHC